jgi:tRNA-2-methylthio-N6-dimethylallyladenosine synthase
MRIAVCGCMTQEKSSVDKIRDSYPYVDLIFGTHNLSRFPEYLCRVYESDMRRLLEAAGEETGPQVRKRRLPKSKTIVEIWDRAEDIVEDLPVLRKYSYKSGINIMFGCDNFCTYCIVPYVRGRERSRKLINIYSEVNVLVKSGYKEITLLGQNVNSYGNGIEGEISFPELLKRVCDIDGIERVRFMTSHPKDLSEDLIQTIKANDKICRHLHLPLQSGSSRVLKEMNRRYTKEQYIDLALKIRSEIPDLAMTTDIMVGFPGETAEDIDDTIDVINKVKYDNAFTFIYSKRMGTPAAVREDQVPDALVKESFDRVLKVVQNTAKEQSLRWQGQVLDALVEEENTSMDGYVTGRLSNNMIVHFEGCKEMIGNIVPVKLDECRGFYYMGSRA